MDLTEELQIEYRRLKRNLADLEEGFIPHVARDLVAGLRNIVELAPEIDALATESGKPLRLPAFVKTKAEKAILKDGSEAFYYPSIVEAENIKIASVFFRHGKLSQEDARRAFEAGPPTMRAKTTVSLNDWLGHAVYEYRAGGELRSISRKLFIKRCANILGGTHPASGKPDEAYIKVFDEQIKELSYTEVGSTPVPWTFVIDSGKAVANALEEAALVTS